MIKSHFNDYPERLKVARVLIENGLNTKNGKIYLNQIEIPPIRVARAAEVDRRTVNETLNAINKNQKLNLIFKEIRPTGPSLKEIAKHLNLCVIELTVTDAKAHGILANTATLLNNANISIRQAIVDDPELSPDPKLTLIIEREIPGELIPEILKIPKVTKISVY